MLSLTLVQVSCSYLRCRLLDASDIFRLDVGVIGGMIVEVTATRHCAVAAGGGQGYYLELLGPHIGVSKFVLASMGLGLWSLTVREDEPVRTLHKPPPSFYFSERASFECCLFLPGMAYVFDLHSRSSKERLPFWEIPRRCNATLFEFSLSIGFGPYLRVSFCPAELLDFLLGWFGIDIMYDDRYRKEQFHASNRR